MINRQEFSNVSELTFSLYRDLVALGFSLKLWRKYGERNEDFQLINPVVPNTDPVQDVAALYIFSANPVIDPFASVEPWDIIIETHPNYMKVWVLTPDCYSIDEYGIVNIKDMPEYVTNDFEQSTLHKNYGYLSENYYDHNKLNVNFLDFREDRENWETSDEFLANPKLSYTLSTDGTGVFIGVYSLPYTDSGRHFAWFAIGRLVDASGNITPKHSGRPVWCVYSLDGGGVGKTLEVMPNADLNKPVLRPTGIRQFCVRESDIHYPTDSMSAVIPNNRFNAVINPLPQTSLREDGTTSLTRLNNFSNWRYTYSNAAYLSIIAYVDAGVHSGSNHIDDTEFYYDIKYHAWLSNFPYNSGMRIYVAEAIDRPNDIGIMYKVILTDVTILFQDDGVRLHSLNVRLLDALSGVLTDALTDLPFIVAVLPSSDAILGSDVETADGNFTSTPQDGMYKIREGEKQSNITFAEFRPSEPKNRALVFRVSFPTLDREPTDIEIIL